jgi:sulfur relay (sulfurtransferase) DsrC/TusE family protein
MVERTISLYFPDIRRILSTLQSRVVDGNLLIENSNLIIIEKEVLDTINRLIVNLLKGERLQASRIAASIQVLLSKNIIDYVRLYKELFDSENVPPFLKMVVNEYGNKHGQCMIPEMNFMSMIYSIIKITSEYKDILSNKKRV